MNSESSKRVFKTSASGQYVSNAELNNYKPKQFKVIYKEDIKLYNPNVVSKRKRVISA